jgi:hypothetical protein
MRLLNPTNKRINKTTKTKIKNKKIKNQTNSQK